MADKTLIEWSDATWNPITGCSRVSRGCGTSKEGGCYAERLAATRLRHHPSRRGLTDARGRWTGEVRFNEQWLDQPFKWKRPRRIFACAHSDLFHEAVPTAWIDKVFGVMALAQRHVFQVLTKRPERMRDYFAQLLLDDPEHGGIARLRWASEEPFPVAPEPWDVMSLARFVSPSRWDSAMRTSWPLPNVWLGTSVEDQRTANERIPFLLETPAAVRWISAEPLLEEIEVFSINGPVDVPQGMESSLHWVVAGGESGPRARTMHPDWARSLRYQCEAAGVPFFFKQWGGRTSKSGGRLLDGRTWDGMPRQEAR